MAGFCLLVIFAAGTAAPGTATPRTAAAASSTAASGTAAPASARPPSTAMAPSTATATARPVAKPRPAAKPVPPKPDRMEFYPRLRASWHLYKADALAGSHHAFSLDFFPYHKHLRVGFFGEAGIQRRLSKTDFIIGVGGIVGVQYNGQWSPYFDMSLFGGAYHHRLFDVAIFDFVFRWSLEAGLEFYPNPGLLMFVGIGYSHLVVFPGFVPSAELRIGIGL